MAEDRTIYKLEGDSSGLVNSLGKASRALDGTAKKADKTDKEIKELGNQSTKTAEKNKRLTSSLGKLNLSLNTAAKGAGVLAGAILGAGAAMGKMLQSMADAQNELSDLSARTGVSTKSLAGLRLAAKGSGQDFKAIASALKPLTLRLGQAAQGSKTAVEGFKAVGVEVLDAEGKLRSADDVLLEITENLNDMEDPTERAAAAALAFGSAGTKLVQALGGQDLKVFSDAAERFGMDIGPAAAKAADDWQRAMANLDLVMRPFTTEVLEFATARVNDFATAWVFLSTLLTRIAEDIIPNVGNLFKALFLMLVRDANDTGHRMADAIYSVIEGLSGFLDRFFGSGIAERIAAAREQAAAIKNEINAALERQLALIASSTSLGDAYRDAYTEAKAFFDLVNVETTRPTGGVGGIAAPDDTKKAGDIDLSKSGMAAEGGIILEDDVNLAKALGTELGRAAGNMNDLTDPTGVFKNLLLDISTILVSIDDLDFKNLEDSLNAVGAVSKAVGGLMQSIIKQVMRSNDELSDKQRKNLKILFGIQKAAAIASIVVDTAAAIMRAYKELGPIAGSVAAGVLGVVGAAQAAVVAAEKPPFHVGGIIPAGPGKQGVMINALPGEAVLNREATAGLGAEGVAALNSGSTMNGGITVEMVYKHRIFDNFVQDNISKGGPLRNAIKSGRRVGHRSRG